MPLSCGVLAAPTVGFPGEETHVVAPAGICSPTAPMHAFVDRRIHG